MARQLSSTPALSGTPAIALFNAAGAYVIWGVVGLYFKLVTGYVEPLTLLAHRVVWSLAFVMIVIAWRGQFADMLAALRSRRMVLGLTATSVLIAINWITFIYAAGTDRLVQASLGYFLTPLANVLLGVIVLSERLRAAQLAAIGFAVAGVALLVWFKAQSLWIPITLMISFSLYGLVRKRTVVGPIVGLAVETALLLPFALAYAAYELFVMEQRIAAGPYALLILAGVITAIPLMMFAYAARRLRLTTLGLLQYLGPSVQFVIATLVLGQVVTSYELLSFAVIWVGLIIFAADGAVATRDARRDAAEERERLAGLSAAVQAPE